MSCLKSGTLWHRAATMCWAELQGHTHPHRHLNLVWGDFSNQRWEGGMLEPHSLSFGHHSDGDRVLWLSQAPISTAWTSAMSLLLSSVTFWPCHGSVPWGAAHSPTLTCSGSQSKPSPNPTPLFFGIK